MRAIYKAVYEWGGTGCTPSFSLTVQGTGGAPSSSLILAYLAREKWVQGPKCAKAHTDLVSALNSRRTSTVGSAVVLPLGSPGYISV